MRPVLAFLLLFQQLPLPPKAGAGQVEVETMGDFHVPLVGPADRQPLAAKGHPSGYVGRPGCSMREIGKKQHALRFENDAQFIWLIEAHPGATYAWHCHGFMGMN